MFVTGACMGANCCVRCRGRCACWWVICCVHMWVMCECYLLRSYLGKVEELFVVFVTWACMGDNFCVRVWGR